MHTSRNRGERPVMKRRTFLLGTASGLSVMVLAACGAPSPQPTASVAPTTTPSVVPQPAAMQRTSWSVDPFARGSFSFPAVGATPEHRTALAEPVLDRIFFAGEATAATEPGTVQGARESGRRAATQVQSVATTEERITVIGAGIAGLTAATQLRSAGFTVIVVEARDRVGGRIDTMTKDWPMPIELGPSFIHNTTVNTLDDEFATLGVSTLPFSRVPEAYTRTGEVVPINPVGAEAVAAALAWAGGQPQDVSVERALVDSGENQLSDSLNDQGLSESDWLEYEISTRLKMDSGSTPSQESAWYATAPGTTDDDHLVVGGYANLLKADAEGLDVTMSSVVTFIAYTDSGVSLRLGAGEALSADRVIVTVPLGVLKDGAVEFSPALPFAHRGAIAALGMGVLDKIWLRFDEPFWDTTAPLWTVVGTDSDFPVWVNMLPITGEPVLMGMVAAENAVRLSEVSDEAFLASALRSLEPFRVTE
ncbi:FAD-dependent oxidoreductase [Cryobacterium sp. MLB-32]|uniref:flavin monoamine oxidase family protein n=1 Tax=Cryobacterium sp. MLB-32 TaxID=1529318 RepID=UPI000691C49F|nr:FAD-dependent oxidoreductase [Cryobacterium sp. MLB-32]